MEAKNNFKTDKQKGYALAELVIAVLISSLVFMTGIFMMIQMGRIKSDVSKYAELETNLRLTEKVLPLYFGQAINVDWTNSSIGDINSGRGKIRSFTSGLGSDSDPPITIGAFLSENGRPNNSLPMSDIRATAIYFKNPTELTPGKLTISNSNQGSGGFVLNSKDSTLTIGSIVQMSLAPPRLLATPTESVRAIKFNITFRRFQTQDLSKMKWCPGNVMNTRPSCFTDLSYRDITRSYNIILPNNMISTNMKKFTGQAMQESIFGKVYFFKRSEVFN